MELKVLKSAEKQMNFVMFLFNIMIPVVAFSYVMLFLGGTARDAIILVMIPVSILIKLFEKLLSKAAKYLYVNVLPIIGMFTIVLANDGKFGAMTHAYILYLVLTIAYYNASVVIANAIVTTAVNAGAMMLFPDSYLLMHNLPIWVFIMFVFMIIAAAALVIAKRTHNLFMKLEEKEKLTSNLVDNVRVSVDNIKASSDTIYGALNQFRDLSHRIASFSKEIADGSMVQTSEVNDGLNMFQELANKIISSENKINKMTACMSTLKENNNIGIASMNDLSDKSGKTTESTEIASHKIEDLSKKSQSIGSIISAINSITQQTNLLALNAAIEAARAGQAGKGFAVVADEIKSLSEQSANSTHKVEEILGDIIEIVNQTCQTMNENKEIVLESNHSLDSTVSAFQNIIHSSDEVLQITSILEKELYSIRTLKDQLLESMKKLAEISENSANSTNKVSASTNEQVMSIDEIMRSMEQVQNSILNLTQILNE